MSILTNNVRAGELRCVADIYGPAVNADGKPLRDAMNAIITAPALVVDGLPARVTEQSGNARYSTAQYVDRMSHIVTIRFRPGVLKGMQVRVEGLVLTVKFVLDPQQRHRWLHLLCLQEGL